MRDERLHCLNEEGGTCFPFLSPEGGSIASRNLKHFCLSLLPSKHRIDKRESSNCCGGGGGGGCCYTLPFLALLSCGVSTTATCTLRQQKAGRLRGLRWYSMCVVCKTRRRVVCGGSMWSRGAPLVKNAIAPVEGSFSKRQPAVGRRQHIWFSVVESLYNSMFSHFRDSGRCQRTKNISYFSCQPCSLLFRVSRDCIIWFVVFILSLCVVCERARWMIYGRGGDHSAFYLLRSIMYSWYGLACGSTSTELVLVRSRERGERDCCVSCQRHRFCVRYSACYWCLSVRYYQYLYHVWRVKWAVGGSTTPAARMVAVDVESRFPANHRYSLAVLASSPVLFWFRIGLCCHRRPKRVQLTGSFVVFDVPGSLLCCSRVP